MTVVSNTRRLGCSTAIAMLVSVILVKIVHAQEDHLIYYGSRTGMHVTIISKSGISSSNAVIMIEHTPNDAKAYCVGYEQDFSAACVHRTMADVKIRDRVKGNCEDNTWTDVYGQAYLLEGNVSSSDCASSDNLEHQRCFPFGGSGSSLIEFMRFQFGGASAA